MAGTVEVRAPALRSMCSPSRLSSAWVWVCVTSGRFMRARKYVFDSAVRSNWTRCALGNDAMAWIALLSPSRTFISLHAREIQVWCCDVLEVREDDRELVLMPAVDQVFEQDGCFAGHCRYGAVHEEDEIGAGEFLREFRGDGAVDLGRASLLVTETLAIKQHPSRHRGPHEAGRGEPAAHAQALHERGDELSEELAVVLVEGAQSSEEFGPVGACRESGG